MAGRLAGKTSIVTGGASGFGAGIARAFAREGAGVLVADLNEERARSVAEEISDTGGRAAFHRVDVTDSRDVEAMVAACAARFGAVEVLVANAGQGQRPCPFEETSDEDLERQFAVALFKPVASDEAHIDDPLSPYAYVVIECGKPMATWE